MKNEKFGPAWAAPRTLIRGSDFRRLLATLGEPLFFLGLVLGKDSFPPLVSFFERLETKNTTRDVYFTGGHSSGNVSSAINAALDYRFIFDVDERMFHDGARISSENRQSKRPAERAEL